MNRPGPGLDGGALLFDGGDGAEGFAHTQVVDQDAVIEVDGEVAGGERVEDVTLVVGAFLDGGLELFALANLAGFVGLRQPFGLGVQLGREVAQVRQHVVGGGRRVAVQIDQRLERALLVGAAGVHPVDRTVLVHLDVVIIKIVDEVFAQRLAQHPLDVGDVLLKMLLAEGHTEEPPESGHDVILEPFILGDRDDVVRVRLERGIRNLRMIVGESLTLGGENQTGFVQRVATEHAADRIGDDLLDDISRHEFITLGRRVLRVCECRITFQRHSFNRHIT